MKKDLKSYLIIYDKGSRVNKRPKWAYVTYLRKWKRIKKVI
jgi:hypothetical protein